jgi:hypothetical protein
MIFLSPLDSGLFMVKWLREAIIHRLHGVNIHVNPSSAVDGITSEDSIRVPFPGGRSPRELLFHIVFWQEYSLILLNGGIGEFTRGMDWNTGNDSWETLIERFENGLSRLEFIAENWELDREVRITEDIVTCVGAEVLGTIQHTSYHLGQLVMSRRALGLWPRE